MGNFYRSKNKVLGGVCAGIATKFGLSIKRTRIVAVITCLFSNIIFWSPLRSLLLGVCVWDGVNSDSIVIQILSLYFNFSIILFVCALFFCMLIPPLLYFGLWISRPIEGSPEAAAEEAMEKERQEIWKSLTTKEKVLAILLLGLLAFIEALSNR